MRPGRPGTRGFPCLRYENTLAPEGVSMYTLSYPSKAIARRSALDVGAQDRLYEGWEVKGLV